MASQVGNIRIEPVNVSWEIEEQTQITCVADVASSLDGKWFGFQASDLTKYYAWLSEGGAGVDPAPAGRTGVEVSYTADDSASAIATAIAAAIAAIAGPKFEASASDGVVTMTNIDPADVESVFDGAAPTGFLFTQTQAGGYLDLGYLQGDVESSFEQKLLEVLAHQTGSTPLAELRQGTGAEIGLVMQETDEARLKEVFSKVAGGSHTPSGGTELFGWGTNLQGTNTIVQARRLVLHPVTDTGNTRARDIVFWKAYPMPESLVFSGENPNVVNVNFKTYLDTSKPSVIQHWAFGDWTQLIPGA